jgi:hypothetical protein
MIEWAIQFDVAGIFMRANGRIVEDQQLKPGIKQAGKERRKERRAK